jgi:TolB protein
MRLLSLVVLAVASLVVVALAGAAPGGRIVFAANQAPTRNDDIYVVPPGGEPRGLSAASSGFDSAPAISPDGTHVAFFSTRGGRAAIYTIASDGSALTQVSPFLKNASEASIAWAPNSRSFAAVYGTPSTTVTTPLATSGVNGGWRVLVPRTSGNLVGYSPDGRELTFFDRTGLVRTIDPTGKTRMVVVGFPGSESWSARGLLLVQRSSTNWNVVDEAGHVRAWYSGMTAASWSPDGRLLAGIVGRTLQFWPSGVRRPSRIVSIGDSAEAQVVWATSSVVRVDAPSGAFGVSAATGQRVALPGLEGQFGTVYSPDGTSAAGFIDGNLAVVSRGVTRTLGYFGYCTEDPPISDLQFARDGSLVYASSCPLASADLYSMASDGSDVRQLTATTADETQPAFSPDGSLIAYVQTLTEARCDDCPRTIWVMNADGSDAHVFPNAAASANMPFDESPSFSPDGKTLLFRRSGVEKSDLFTVPVAGGAATNLGFDGSQPAWGPRQIAYNTNDGLTVSSIDGRSAQVAAPDGTFGSDVPAWSTDGRLAVLESNGSSLAIAIPSTKTKIPLLGLTSPNTGKSGAAGGLAWSPDGSTFAFTAASPTDPYGDVYEIGVDGSHLTQITHGVGAVGNLSWR